MCLRHLTLNRVRTLRVKSPFTSIHFSIFIDNSINLVKFMNLNQVTIPSRDLSQSVKFYELLGLRIIVDSLPRYARFECPSGDSTFSIHHVDELPTGSGIVIYFECEQLDDDVDRLQSLGVSIETQPTDQNWLWREASLLDPDGNKIILFNAGENRKNPPWRI